MSDLKPCPKGCVESAFIVSFYLPDTKRFQAWGRCGSGSCFEGPSLSAATQEEAERLAAEAWNTRPAAVPVEALKELRDSWLLVFHARPCASELNKLIDLAERRELVRFVEKSDD